MGDSVQSGDLIWSSPGDPFRLSCSFQSTEKPAKSQTPDRPTRRRHRGCPPRAPSFCIFLSGPLLPFISNKQATLAKAHHSIVNSINPFFATHLGTPGAIPQAKKDKGTRPRPTNPCWPLADSRCSDWTFQGLHQPSAAARGPSCTILPPSQDSRPDSQPPRFPTAQRGSGLPLSRFML